MITSFARALCLAGALRVASPLQPGMAYKPQWELPFPRTPAAMHDALFAALSDMIGSGESRIAVDLLDVFGSRPPPAPLMPLQRAPASAAASADAPPALERVDPFAGVGEGQLMPARRCVLDACCEIAERWRGRGGVRVFVNTPQAAFSLKRRSKRAPRRTAPPRELRIGVLSIASAAGAGADDEDESSLRLVLEPNNLPPHTQALEDLQRVVVGATVVGGRRGPSPRKCARRRPRRPTARDARARARGRRARGGACIRAAERARRFSTPRSSRTRRPRLAAAPAAGACRRLCRRLRGRPVRLRTARARRARRRTRRRSSRAPRALRPRRARAPRCSRWSSEAAICRPAASWPTRRAARRSRSRSTGAGHATGACTSASTATTGTCAAAPRARQSAC